MTLVERLRAEKDYRVVDFTPVSTTKPLCAEAADRIEELEARYEKSQDQIDRLIAENERLRNAGDGDVGLIHWQGERIEQLEAALREIARLRTDLNGDFSLGSRQSDIARAALGEKE